MSARRVKVSLTYRRLIEKTVASPTGAARATGPAAAAGAPSSAAAVAAVAAAAPAAAGAAAGAALLAEAVRSDINVSGLVWIRNTLPDADIKTPSRTQMELTSNGDRHLGTCERLFSKEIKYVSNLTSICNTTFKVSMSRHRGRRMRLTGGVGGGGGGGGKGEKGQRGGKKKTT